MTEVYALSWRKSSRSSGTGGTECVEVASVRCARHSDDEVVEGVVSSRFQVAVRDSKDPDGPVLRFGAVEWASFVARVRAGRARP